MKRIIMAAGAAASILAAGAAPGVSQADTRHRVYHHRVYRRSDCWAAHHQAARNGTVIGALAGGFLGSQLSGRGSRTGGMLLGAGAGAVAGHQVGAHSHRC
ncbi:MAG: glycine zipper 2TM domain-containing protein [Caulobacteraceae bacterium]